MSKILVLYYSSYGHIETLAKTVVEVCGMLTLSLGSYGGTPNDDRPT